MTDRHSGNPRSHIFLKADEGEQPCLVYSLFVIIIIIANFIFNVAKLQKSILTWLLIAIKVYFIEFEQKCEGILVPLPSYIQLQKILMV